MPSSVALIILQSEIVPILSNITSSFCSMDWFIQGKELNIQQKHEKAA